MFNPYVDIKNKELKDNLIMDKLANLSNMYENGEIAEVQTIMDEISEAIDIFDGFMICQKKD